MSDLPMRLRRNCHFDDCQEAADEIERLQERFDYAVKKNGEQWAEIERLKERNALLEDVAVAADDVAQYCEIDAGGWMDSLIDAIDKLREGE